MMSQRFTLLLATLLLAAPVAHAAPSTDARREIAELISSLDGSQCRFQRNGSWYDGSDARAHLQRKYDYLLKKDMVDSAEQFIERAASQSSMSGKPYRIQCPGQPEQTAAAWFGARLQALRHRAP
ncbi:MULTISPECIES: YfeK family protein [unclassified Stenotrophomonas]|uniref:YfeK family protein n=1 Tax=unclassified Stenotrophomonas TaxID=196198 RepID=UPI0024494169|nr:MULTISPECIES: YfeK family protein [unclassified Stenotrophomonas]MBN5160772.1 YfeK family protein [Stenotrophomonas maltophilia]MDG9843630.1 YfeK family protein [Stenotrophomonas sp. GD04054]MDH0019419.1 YfeK family protein [Stenotrophomonas sp. GD04028]MDH0575806.1 YfeK family protein [Stenotrophomonas sp. GD03997]MDH0859165.1 YfeK family protein [Stenotrophomonas sp. GD03882]